MISTEVLGLANTLARLTDTDLLPGVSAAQLEALESELGLSLPWDLRELLASLAGPYLIDGRLLTCSPSDPRTDIAAVARANPVYRAEGWIPLAVDSGGNPFVVLSGASHPDGTPVAFIDREANQWQLDYLVASTVWLFGRFLFEREIQVLGIKAIKDEDEWDKAYDTLVYWPFDEDKVLARDPKLATLTGAPLPWDSERPTRRTT
jgi:hypothetical protein